MSTRKQSLILAPDVQENRDAVIIAFAKANGFYQRLLDAAANAPTKANRGKALYQEVESIRAKGLCLYFEGFDPGENGWLLYLWVKRNNLPAINAAIAQIELEYGLSSDVFGGG